MAGFVKTNVYKKSIHLCCFYPPIHFKEYLFNFWGNCKQEHNLHFSPTHPTSYTTDPLLFGLLEEELLWQPLRNLIPRLPCFSPLNFPQRASSSVSWLTKPSRGMWKTKTELVTALNYPPPTSFLRKEILYIAYPDHLILSPNPKLFFCVYISTGACREGGPIWLLSGFTHHCFPVSASCINKISKAGGWGWDSWSESAFARRRKPNIVCIIHPVFLVLESNTILRSLPS